MGEAPLITRLGIEGEADVLSALNQLRQAFRQQGADVKMLNESMRQYSGGIYGARRGIMLLRTEIRQQMAEFLELGRTLRDIGSIGRNVVQIWQAYSIAQIRTTQAAQNLREAQSRISITQSHLTELRRQGLTTTEEYLNAQIALNKAITDEKDRRNELNKAQQENIIGYAGMALQMADIAARSITLILHLRVLRALTVGQTAATWSATAAEYAHTAALWLKAKAAAVVQAMTGNIPLLIAGGIAAGATIAWIASEQTKARRGMQIGGMVPETGWYYAHKGEAYLPVDLLRSLSMTRTTQITIHVHGARAPHETADAIKQELHALRMRGVI